MSVNEQTYIMIKCVHTEQNHLACFCGFSRTVHRSRVLPKYSRSLTFSFNVILESFHALQPSLAINLSY